MKAPSRWNAVGLAVWSTSDGKAKKEACANWRVHGEAPMAAPPELLKRSVLVGCESPRAHYAVRLGTGEVLSLAEPSKPLHLDVGREAAASAGEACAHIYE